MMIKFEMLPEFEKELKRLEKKYRTLQKDLRRFEKVVTEDHLGLGKNFTVIHRGENLAIVKTRLLCMALQDRSIRLIYAYHNNTLTFCYIEIYFKGDKPNEDRNRVAEYIKLFNSN